MNSFLYLSNVISSAIDLPELPKTTGDENAAYYFFLSESCLTEEKTELITPIYHWRSESDNTISLSLAKSGTIYQLIFPTVALFEIRYETKSITAYAHPKTTVATIRHLLLDQVLPRVFAHFKNWTLFHASSVIFKDRIICFIGDSGYGKSTLAAACTENGFAMPSDDCTRLFEKNGQIFAMPNYYGLRLFTDSIAQTAIQSGAEQPTQTGNRGKIRILSKQPPMAQPVAALFLLADPLRRVDVGRQECKISSCNRADIVISLLKYCYCLDVHDENYIKSQFLQVSSIASSDLPIYNLCHKRDFRELSKTVRAIKDKLKR